MAININTDIAQEINITARRGDTFQMGLSVVDPTTSTTYDLSGAQSGTANTIVNYYSTTGFSPQITFVPIYQAKMSIKKQGSEFDVLSVFTFMWQDVVFSNVLPSLTRAGKYRGEGSGSLTSQATAGIYLASSTGAVDDLIHIRIPAAYMNMTPGTYVYDFQVRKKTFFSAGISADSIADLSADYTTWFKGNMIVNNDITKS